MSRLERHFADYADHHRDRRNKLTHFVGIPVIALALFGLAARVVVATLPGGATLDLGVLLASVLVLVYLLWWHAGLAAGIALLFLPLYLAGRALPVLWLWPLLAAGVALQYAGHYLFERRAPAFHQNLTHTLVGPLWVAANLLRALGLYRAPVG
ncbi:MAG: DUF962 domain-containing protein [Acidobacteria bacterium]|nr:MAG: DUF962 domain-containing protein [Acidobacteriota bacterium]